MILVLTLTSTNENLTGVLCDEPQELFLLAKDLSSIVETCQWVRSSRQKFH